MKAKKVVLSMVFAIMFGLFSLAKINAGSTTIGFNNGGVATLSATPTSARGTAYSDVGFACQSTIVITIKNKPNLTVGPISRVGSATAYRNNLLNVQGAQGTFYINGERSVGVVSSN